MSNFFSTPGIRKYNVISNNANINNLNSANLNVYGNTILNNNLDVSGTSTLNNLNVYGNTILNNIDISGNIKYNNGTIQTSAYTGGNSGTYTNCNITIDYNGKISQISNGTNETNNIASIYGIANGGGEYYDFNINVNGGISGEWPQNTFFTVKITYSIIWGFDGSGNQNAQYYANTIGTYDIYPYRFVPYWCYIANDTPYANMSTNTINNNSAFGLVDTSNNNEIAPYGRQFWGYNIIFNTNTNGVENNVQLYCTGQDNQLQLQIPNPAGWGSSGYPVQYSITVELINTGNHYSNI